MEQFLLHVLGDYVTQSDWMANNKTFACLCHAVVYGLPFLLLGPSWTALFVIISTHFLIDRYRLAKYICYAKNFIAPRSSYSSKMHLSDGTFHDENTPFVWRISEKFHWENCKTNGYPSETPVWLSTWLMIFADNWMHLTINFLALKYL